LHDNQIRALGKISREFVFSFSMITPSYLCVT
jgi:hypothetical protein